jgi:regulator of protease activity HflC (stomatin/prohibitin superfamily)
MAWVPEKATLEVANYRRVVAWAAQTAMREIIGKTQLRAFFQDNNAAER